MKNFRNGSGYEKKQAIEKKLKDKRDVDKRIEVLEKESKERKDKAERIEVKKKQEKKAAGIGCLVVLIPLLLWIGISMFPSEKESKNASVEKYKNTNSQKIVRKINESNHKARIKARIEFMQTDKYKMLQKKGALKGQKVIKLTPEQQRRKDGRLVTDGNFYALEAAQKIIRMSIVKQGESAGIKLIYYDDFIRWEAFDNPEGDEKGLIVVHFGYEVWLFVNGKLYPVNGAASVVTPDLPYAKSISFGDIEPYITKKHQTSYKAIFLIKQSIDRDYEKHGLDNPI